MILGRNAGLWVAAVGAIVNALVVLGYWHLAGDGLAAVNFVILAVTGLVANEADPTTLGTFVPSIKAPSTSPTPSAPSATSPGVPATGSGVDPTFPTPPSGGSGTTA